MSEWKVELHKRVVKQAEDVKRVGLEPKVKELIQLLRKNPFQSPPSYEKLRGDLNGFYSQRINRHHRMVYEVLEETKTVRVLSVWTHYEDI